MKTLGGILLSFLYTNVVLAQSEKPTIYLELKFEASPISKPIPDSIIIGYFSYPGKLWDTLTRNVRRNDNTKWVISTDKPMIVDVSQIEVGNKYNRWLLEPGDSIVALSRDGELYFSGRGAAKLNMNNEIYTLKEAMPKPSYSTFYSVLSVDDFLECDNYLNRRMALSEFVINSYKDLVSPLAIYQAKASAIIETEVQRWEKFRRLSSKKYFDLDRKELSKLFDDHFFTSQAKWIWEQPLPAASQLPLDGWFKRRYNFPFEKNVIASSTLEFYLKYWEFGKGRFRGEALERFLAQYLTYYIIGKQGFQSKVDSTLNKYYADKDRDPEYQAYVKEYERKARILKKSRTIPPFTVYESSLKGFTKIDLKEKVTVFNFVKPGNKASEVIANNLKKVKERFKNNPYVKILNLPINLQSDTVIRKFNLTGYPAVFVMDIRGRLMTSSFIKSTLNEVEINKIVGEQAEIAKKEEWQGSTDGPYIMNTGNAINVYQVKGGSLATLNGRQKSLIVATDQPDKTFKVTLKNTYDTEPSIFPRPDKLMAFSDIEGEFEPLRLLLQNNKVIDEQFNWIFGKGHIVFAGDMFDRGEQVTECLWLMYSLEEKAKAAGGYVHFILGNHEIMNLNGNHKYTRTKYKENVQKVGKSLVELYGPNSELGKWLRCKNIVEKIGDILFMHAGISKEVSDLGLTVSQINELARPWYDNSVAVKESNDTRLKLLYDSELSPFWYREYYLEQPVKTGLGNNRVYLFYKTPESVIDGVLKRYEVNKIVTGHTVWEGVKDRERGKWLSSHYDGKVINLDTYHKRGFSEALLIEAGKYFAVNKNGEKRKLLSDAAQNTQVASK